MILTKSPIILPLFQTLKLTESSSWMCPECVDSSARKSEYAAGIGVARKGEGAEDSKEKVKVLQGKVRLQV